MASGLPDYYRGVDIAYQALSQMIVRPKYGGANVAFGEVEVSASGETAIVSISGKGMVYGGVLALDHTSSQAAGTPRLYVDGELIADSAFVFLNKFGLIVENSYAIYLARFDDVNFIYSGVFSRGITFETTLEVRYREVDGGIPVVAVLLVFALI